MPYSDRGIIYCDKFKKSISIRHALHNIFEKSGVSRDQGKSPNAIVREALEEWCQRHANTKWEPGFFDFEPILDVPNFNEYRKEFKSIDEDPLA